MAEGEVLGENLHDVGVDVGVLGSEVGVDWNPGCVVEARRKKEKNTN